MEYSLHRYELRECYSAVDSRVGTLTALLATSKSNRGVLCIRTGSPLPYVAHRLKMVELYYSYQMDIISTLTVGEILGLPKTPTSIGIPSFGGMAKV